MPFELSLRHALLDHENLAVALKDAQELHTTVNSLRLQLVIDPLPRRSLMVLQMAAGNLWTKRSRFQHYTELPRFEPAVRERIGADLLELALLRAEVHVRLVPPVNQPQAAQEALQMLKEAQTLLGPHPALLMEQRRSADALELLLLRDEMDIVLKAHPPRTAWEYAFVGRAHLRRGDYEAAEKALRHAHQMQPLHFLPNFYLGVCAHRRSKYTESIGAFSFCLGQEPHAEIFYLRGLGLAALGLDADARVDFNQAITRDAYLGPAYFQRGLLHAKSGHHADARADFERSLSHGGARIPTKCEIARTLLAEKNWQAARDCLDRVLEEEPACAVARTLLKGIP